MQGLTDATVYIWHYQGHSGRDVVCAACQKLPDVVREYCTNERDEVEIEIDGTLERECATDEDTGRDYWRRFQRARCALCGAVVSECEL